MQVKDALLALVEAVRLARLELSVYRDGRYRGTPERMVQRLGTLLEDKKIDAAMALMVVDTESPSIVPQRFDRVETSDA
jgi:hypothetical protein